MMTDPRMAELPFVAYAEPARTLFSVAFAAPDQPVRACPEWVKCGQCSGYGKHMCRTGVTKCVPCCGTGTVEAATGGLI